MSPKRDEDAGEADVRARLLEAADDILRESGIRKLSQVQVARRAGVRQSHLTYYFPKRHDLFEALAARFVEGITEGLREAAEGASEEGTQAYVLGLAEAIADEEHMRLFIGVIAEADQNPELRELLVHGADRMVESLSAALGGDHAAARAEVLLAAMWGLGLHNLLVRRPLESGTRDALLSYLAGGG
jgi:AcrR family transcriptional regulator